MDEMQSPEAQRREKLNVFITLATTALQHRRVGEPSKLERHNDNILRILQHVTALITTGTPRNIPKPKNDSPNAASRVVAVTANVRNDSIRTLLVTTNTSLGVSPVETKIDSLGGKREGEDVLSNWEKRDLASHYDNVFDILDFFRRNAATRAQSLERFEIRCAQFHCYIVNHVYYKIAACMNKDSQTWVKNPLDTLASYSLSNLRSRLSFPKTLTISKALAERLQGEYGIHSSSPPSAQVTSDNVGQWIKVTMETFVGIRTIFFNDSNKCKPNIGEDDVMKAVDDLVIFRDLLRCRIVDFLLSDQLLAEEMNRKPSDLGDKAKQASSAAMVSVEPTNGEEDARNSDMEGAEDDEDDEDVFAGDLVPEPSEDPIIRYLKTIVSWTTAVDSLALKPPPLPIRAHSITVPHPTIPNLDQYISEFEATLLENSDLHDSEKDTARDLLSPRIAGVRPIFNLTEKTVSNALIHAEALLMALSRSFYSSEAANVAQAVLHVNTVDRQVLEEIFQTERTPIAISNKCCWCCWELYQYWHPNKAESKDGQSSGAPDLVLLGTHSIIYPWYPPPIAVPVQFLQTLEEKLRTMLIGMLEIGAKSVGGKSGQLSARSSFDELPVDIVRGISKLRQFKNNK